MTCCPANIITFAGVAFSSIPYSDTMKAQYGADPQVVVYYYDEATGGFYSTNGLPGTEIKFTGSTIEIDHGGIQSGYLKIN
jgi:hypothetical protein